MPIYLFENPETGEVVEKFFSMSEKKQVVIDGVEYIRLYTVPNAARDTQIDPFNEKDFVKATDKVGTMGDLMDRSSELSAKRADKEGVDPIKQQYYKNYARTRRGAKHPDVRKSESKQKLSKLGVTLQ